MLAPSMRCALAAVLCLTLPTAARAQSAVDRGIAAYEQGEFDAARAAFTEAEQSDDLRRDDLVRLLATRALLSFAEGQSEAMLRDLAALATLEPEHDLGPRAPPALRDAFEQAREGGVLRVSVEGERTPGGVEVRAQVRGDRAGLVRRLSLAARSDGPWVRSQAGSVSLTGTPPAVEYHAQAVGPGGATLVEDGTEAVPQRIVLPPIEEPSAGGDDGVAIGLGLAAGVVLAAGAVLAVVLVAEQGGDRVDTPAIEWP